MVGFILIGLYYLWLRIVLKATRQKIVLGAILKSTNQIFLRLHLCHKFARYDFSRRAESARFTDEIDKCIHKERLKFTFENSRISHIRAFSS
jgi:hypothetical protein